MPEPMQVTREQLQAIQDALHGACVTTYSGYQLTDSDVLSVNQQLQNNGVEVDLRVVHIDFANQYGAGGLAAAFQGIENAIKEGFTNAIKHLCDPSYFSGNTPSSTAGKLDEIKTAIQSTAQPYQDQHALLNKLDDIRFAVDALTEASILGTRTGEPIPKDKAQRAAKKVYDALQAKPDVFEALMTLLTQEQAATVAKLHPFTKPHPLTSVVHDSVSIGVPFTADADLPKDWPK